MSWAEEQWPGVGVRWLKFDGEEVGRTQWWFILRGTQWPAVVEFGSGGGGDCERGAGNVEHSLSREKRGTDS